MLKELVLKDFKSFREETVRFSPSGLTVLVGPNGSGKSSVLEAVFFTALQHFSSRLVRNPALVRQGCTEFQAKLTVDAGGVEPDALVSLDVKQTTPVLTELAWRRGAWKYVVTDGTGELPIGYQHAVESAHLVDVLNSVPFPAYFEVDLRKLRLPLRPAADAHVFGEQQVVQALFDLKLGADDKALGELVSRLRAVVPAVRGVGISREPSEEKDHYRLSFNTSTGTGIDASQASEGTLFALAVLAAAARFAAKRSVLLIDDIDRALHPTAQRELIKLLRAIVKEGNLEIICTTHSPYILSEFQYDEVRVLKEVDGASRCMSLSDGPEAQRWMKELDAGEYWSFIEHKLFQKSA